MLSRLSLQVVLVASLVSQIVIASERSTRSPEFAILRKVYNDCQSKDDFTGCLKYKALAVVSRAINQDVIHIVDGLSFEKQNTTTEESIFGHTDARTWNGLSPLDRILLQKVDKFLQTHSLTLELGEGRGKDKDKKMSKYVIAALLTAMGIAAPLGLKALAIVAGKALVVSKVALTIAGILALKKIFANDHPEETSVQVHAGDHNRRNTYLLKPVKPTQQPVDPYRYYYEYPTQ